MERNVGKLGGSASDASSEVKQVNFMEALWGVFSSMKTAIVLLLLLAVASIAGTVIPQGEPVGAYTQIYGPGKGALVLALDLDNLFHARWYMLLLALIGVNLTVCSINRFGMAYKRMYKPNVAANAKQVTAMQRTETFSTPDGVEKSAETAEAALRSRSYLVMKESSHDAVSIYASKGRVSVWGPYLTHVSLLVIFAGAIVGSVFGFNGFTIIQEGKRTDDFHVERLDRNVGGIRREPKELGFEVGLRKFTILHDGKHNPTGYKSDLQVYKNGKLVAEKVIDVNHPLTYEGISFFQSDYGLTGLVLKVTVPNGESELIPVQLETQNGPGGKSYLIAENALRQVERGGKKLSVYVHNFAPDYVGGEMVNAGYMPINPAAQVMVNERFPEYKGLDAWKQLGWLELSKPVEHNGFTIELADVVDYTGLQVAKNPGLPLIYVGFALMMIGMVMSFYMTHRVVRVRAEPAEEGARVTVGATSRSEPSTFDTEFKRLSDSLGGGGKF